jgi:hypothetical protein
MPMVLTVIPSVLKQVFTLDKEETKILVYGRIVLRMVMTMLLLSVEMDSNQVLRDQKFLLIMQKYLSA